MVSELLFGKPNKNIHKYHSFKPVFTEIDACQLLDKNLVTPYTRKPGDPTSSENPKNCTIIITLVLLGCIATVPRIFRAGGPT